MQSSSLTISKMAENIDPRDEALEDSRNAESEKIPDENIFLLNLTI